MLCPIIFALFLKEATMVVACNVALEKSVHYKPMRYIWKSLCLREQ